jgi:hypothetical protein
VAISKGAAVIQSSDRLNGGVVVPWALWALWALALLRLNISEHQYFERLKKR